MKVITVCFLLAIAAILGWIGTMMTSSYKNRDKCAVACYQKYGNTYRSNPGLTIYGTFSGDCVCSKTLTEIIRVVEE